MIQKDIFSSPKPLENLLNRSILAFLAKGNRINIPDDPENYINHGYAGNVNIYPIIRKIVTPAKGVKWLVKDEAGEEVLDSELGMLLKNPNKNQSINEYIDEQMCWRLITGNSYTIVMSPEFGNNKGKPAEIIPMPASLVQIVAGDFYDPVLEYVLSQGNQSIRFPKEKVVHTKYTNLTYDTQGSQLYGMSPLKAALKVMAATNDGYSRLQMNFENGGPDIIMTNTENGAGSNEWTEEQKTTIYERMKKFFVRKERWMFKNKPVEIHEIGQSVVDLNVLEFIKLSLRDYCNIYGVPSALMNDNEYATQSANAREYQRMLWNNAIIPELERQKDEFNRIAAISNKITGLNLTIDYDLSDIPELQADNSLMSQSLSTAWWLTPNQRLQMMGLPMDEENELMNQVYVPLGLVPLEELTAPTEEQVKSFYDRNRIKY